MKLPSWLISVVIVLLGLGLAQADGQSDMIPELKDIEKIAAEQESAIKAQSEALAKSQKEKEAAEKAALQALEQHKAAPKPTEMAATSNVTEPNKPVTLAKHKAFVAKPAPSVPKVDPWLAQERRYTFP